MNNNDMSNFSKFAEAALAAYDAGFNPNPILPDTKHPARKWNKRVKKLSRKKIAKYWKQHPDHEVAILLNDELFVCDADTPEAVTALYQLEEDLDLTPKVIVQTTRGEHHYFFRAPGTKASTYAPDKKKHPDGIDIKTGHTLLLIPPSTGKTYLQGDITSLAELTVVNQAQIDTFDRHNSRGDRPDSPKIPVTPMPPSNLGAATDELKSFLPHLDPDMGYTDWTNVLMVIFHQTGGAEEGLQLAIEWSSKGAKFQGDHEIHDKWESFDPDHENPVSVGTLYELVKQEVGEARYLDIYHTLGPQWDLSGGATVITKISAPTAMVAANDDVNPLLAYSLLGKSKQLKKEFADHELIFGKIAIRGQWTVLYAPSNNGKTLVLIWLITQAIKNKIIAPQQVFYINADDGGSSIATKAAIADKNGFNMLVPGHGGFKIKNLLTLLAQVSNKGLATDTIIVLDTLKKFTDLMNKSELRKFNNAIRQFSAKGGTVIALAHTNKNRDDDGKLVYSGTTDVIDDADCVYVIDILDDTGDVRTVELENRKQRGDVARKAVYQYSTAEGLTYEKLLKSVVEVDPEASGQLRNDITFEASGDKLLIELVKGFMTQGINTKTSLVTELAKQDGVSKSRATKLIEGYTGTDPIKHRWSVKKKKHNKHVYSVLPVTSPDPVPAAEDPPEDS